MERQPPRATSDEIDLYIRTYYSLLRSSGDVKVRAFEEAPLPLVGTPQRRIRFPRRRSGAIITSRRIGE